MLLEYYIRSLYFERMYHVIHKLSIIVYRVYIVAENVMGNSLYNKIYLGRSSVLASRPLRVALTIGMLALLGLAWMVLRGFK